MPALSLRSLTKLYPGGGGVSDISFDIPSGEHLVVVGPSGAGKTTLLRLLAGLETADSGSLHFNGVDVTNSPACDRGTAFVAQKPALYPHLTARRNLSVGVDFRQSKGRLWRRLTGQTDPLPTEEIARRVDEAAALLGLSSAMLDRRPHELSGGEQQRLALGRAFVSRANLWLLDEPFAQLDPRRRDELRSALPLLTGPCVATIVEVTHDPIEALTLGRVVAVLDGGRRQQLGRAAEVVARPAGLAAATSLGWPPINMIEVTAAGPLDRPVLGTPDGGFTLLVPAAMGELLPYGRRVTLGIRAEDLQTSGGEIDLGEWNVVRRDDVGPGRLTVVERAGIRWRTWNSMSGERVALTVRADRCHWFDTIHKNRIDDAPTHATGRPSGE